MDELNLIAYTEQMITDVLLIAITKEKEVLVAAYNDFLQNCWKLYQERMKELGGSKNEEKSGT